MQRWARLLKQQSSVTVYRYRPRKTNFHFPFPFAAKKWMFAISVFCLQQTHGSCHFLLVPFSACVCECVCGGRGGGVCVGGWGVCVGVFVYMLPFQTEAQAIFLNPFNVCSSCERKFVVCLFIDEETTNRIYPFANGLAHLCKYDI